MTSYTALRGIAAPGTSVFGYQRGHAVSESVVENWSLVVGEANDPDADVVEGDLPDDAPAERLVRRPEEGANRAAWEGYAIASGMPAAEAMVASQEDLETFGVKPPAKKSRSTSGTKVGDTVAVAATEANQA